MRLEPLAIRKVPSGARCQHSAYQNNTQPGAILHGGPRRRPEIEKRNPRAMGSPPQPGAAAGRSLSRPGGT